MNPNSFFPITSRYYWTGTEVYETAGGRKIAHLQRRFIPLPDRYSTIGTYTVRQADRPDIVAYQQMADPLQFWRICDPNAVLHPEELTERPGANIRITLAEGIPGTPNA